MATKKFLGSIAAKAILTQGKAWADGALADAKTYADGEIAKVIGGAPENLDTLKEIADILSNDESTKLGLVQQMAQKANKSTTLAGYGITDAKIVGGVITLGGNTITPLTQHQSLDAYAKTADVNASIAGKADKGTTLAAYGITDAKIAGGVITLGDNTITPITSHQSLAAYAKTADMNSALNLKANKSDVDTTLAAKVNEADLVEFTQAEINAIIAEVVG